MELLSFSIIVVDSLHGRKIFCLQKEVLLLIIANKMQTLFLVVLQNKTLLLQENT